VIYMMRVRETLSGSLTHTCILSLKRTHTLSHFVSHTIPYISGIDVFSDAVFVADVVMQMHSAFFVQNEDEGQWEVCVYIHTSISVYIFSTCTRVHVCIHLFICMHVCIHLCMHVRTYILHYLSTYFPLVHICMYVYIYSFACTCVYIRVYIYMYIYVHKTFLYVYVHRYTYMSLYTYVYICTYRNIYVYICT